jgi:ketosteroid isomerase-like protein
MSPISLRAGWLLAAALPLAAPAFAASRPIDTLADAERGFAAMSVAQGMRPAFLEWLAEDAVIFRPGPLNGQQSWRARSAPAGVLDWAPAFVELSGSEDLGFSTGPWEYRSKPDANPEAFGHFLSVWRRDAAGAWRVALDCGGSHERPERGLHEVKLTEGPAHARPDSNAWKKSGVELGGAVRRGNTTVGVGTGGAGGWIGGGGMGLGLGMFGRGVRSRADYDYQRTSHEKNGMMSADRALGWNAKKSGWERAYAAVAAGDLRCYREGAEPTLGADAAGSARAGQARDVSWEYRGNGIAKSWDMGWAYGLVLTRGKSRTDTSAFVHLWRKDDAGAWKMVADWEGAYPKR